MRQTSLKTLLQKRCCSHRCPRSLQAVPGQQLSICSGCKAVYYCDRQCQKDAWPLHKSICQLHRASIQNSSVQVDLEEQRLILLRKFVGLHRHAFFEAAISCVAMQGGAKTFDFQGRVLLFGLRPRNLDDNPGTAFSFIFAECLSISELYEELPEVKEPLQAAEENYNSVAEFNQATMENFAGLLRMAYWADGLLVTKHLGIISDPATSVTDHEGWQSQLQHIVDNGLVAKEVGDTLQVGKIVKLGSQWKWVPRSSIS